jgi:hypothetical protein
VERGSSKKFISLTGGKKEKQILFFEKMEVKKSTFTFVQISQQRKETYFSPSLNLEITQERIRGIKLFFALFIIDWEKSNPWTFSPPYSKRCEM